MMAVWADDDDIYGVHPQGPRLIGMEQVRESWRQIFASGQRLSFQVRNHHTLDGMMMSVHSVYEHVAVAGEPRGRQAVVATNVYLRTERGWRMVAHHASAAPAAAADERARPAPLLH
jgi:ketosteroid isomerase-like protein